MNSFKPKNRAFSAKTEDAQNSVKTKSSRKGTREGRQYSFNKPTRNIKFLEVSRVNSILPDKYQLGLQPIKKKELPPDLGARVQLSNFKSAASMQTEPRTELKVVEFKSTEI